MSEPSATQSTQGTESSQSKGLAQGSPLARGDCHDSPTQDELDLLQYAPRIERPVRMKIPELQRDDGLAHVVFTTVNMDEKPTLAQRLLRGSSVPQLVLFTQSAKGWRRARLTGVQTPQAIRRFIGRQMVAAQGDGESRTKSQAVDISETQWFSQPLSGG